MHYVSLKKAATVPCGNLKFLDASSDNDPRTAAQFLAALSYPVIGAVS